MEDALYAGIDAGTSGLRLCLIDGHGTIRHLARHPLPEPDSPAPGWHQQDPALWQAAMETLLHDLPARLRARLVALAIDGTSGTLIACDSAGTPRHPALMYHDRRATPQAARLAGVVPTDSPARGVQTSLARALWLRDHLDPPPARLLHQAEWLAACLTGRPDLGDENNALKLGYDPLTRRWPDWLEALGLPAAALPEIRPPGTPLAPVAPARARALGLPADLTIVAGTTDSIAAFLAAGAREPGDAVTSLGSTLAVKLLCTRPVSTPEYGIYSHRLWDRWLAGGASNTGGRVLRRYFDDSRLAELTDCLEPERPTGLDYYPLPEPGERFPVADPELPPRLSPRPGDDCRFLQGLLEGMARIEAEGYRRLAELGAPRPRRVFTSGGGAHNPAWTAIRARALGVPVLPAACGEAACGAALLAARGIMGELPQLEHET